MQCSCAVVHVRMSTLSRRDQAWHHTVAHPISENGPHSERHDPPEHSEWHDPHRNQHTVTSTELVAPVASGTATKQRGGACGAMHVMGSSSWAEG